MPVPRGYLNDINLDFKRQTIYKSHMTLFFYNDYTFNKIKHMIQYFYYERVSMLNKYYSKRPTFKMNFFCTSRIYFIFIMPGIVYMFTTDSRYIIIRIFYEHAYIFLSVLSDVDIILCIRIAVQVPCNLNIIIQLSTFV